MKSNTFGGQDLESNGVRMEHCSSLTQIRCNFWSTRSWIGHLWFPRFQAPRPYIQAGVTIGMASLYHLVHTAVILAVPITRHPNIFRGLLMSGILAFSGTYPDMKEGN